MIHGLIQTAASEGKAEKVAIHLISALLRLRVRAEERDNDITTAGRFHVGSSTFYVAMRPKPGHFESMKHDALVGLSPHLIVPRDRLAGARDNAEDAAPGRFTVMTIEDFVAQSVDAAGHFSTAGVKTSLRTLLDAYNERVTQIEGGRSLTIELPKRHVRTPLTRPNPSPPARASQ